MLQKTSNCTYLGCRTTQARVIILDEHTIRVTHAPLEQNGFSPDRPWVKDVLYSFPQTTSNTNHWVIECKHGCVHINNELEGGTFSEAEPVVILPEGQFQFQIALQKEESVYGWGEWFKEFRRTNSSFSLVNKESPAQLQNRQTYSNIPVFYSSKGYYFFLLNSTPTHWKINSGKGLIEVAGKNGPVDYLIFFGKDPKKALEAYTYIMGRPALVPRWAYGLWVTSFPQEDQEKTLNLVKKHRQMGIPLDGIILDYHWEEKFHNFQWRKKLFPNPNRFIQQLTSLGVKLGLIFTPFVNFKNSIFQKLMMATYIRSIPSQTLRDDERDIIGYTQGVREKYFANNNALWWFGKGGMLDFTNPAARNWWNEKLKPLYKQGIAFFKNDDGEYLPKDANSHIGIPANEYHNLYGFYYGKAIYEGMQELDNRRPLIYARSVWAGSQRYPALFLGDQVPTFENLKRTIRAGLNMSLLGFAYWTADCFGLNGKTSPELHIRYAQWALMVPIARYFVRPPEIDNTRYPWSHNEHVEASFHRHVDLRYRLLPYYHSLGWQANRSGTPIIRPLFMEFPQDKTSYAIDDQVLLGDVLMLAPVVHKNAKTRSIYFPPGKWFDYWSGEEIQGGQRKEIPVSLDYLPIFVRSNSIIPMCAPVQSISLNPDFRQIDFHCWPPFEGDFNWRNDDGLTTNNQKGIFSEMEISLSSIPTEKKISCAIQPKKKFPNDKIQTFSLIFHNIEKPGKILVQGKGVNTYKYEGENRTLTIMLEAKPTKQTIQIKGIPS